MKTLALPMNGNWLIDPRAGRMIQSGLAERMRADTEDVPRMWSAANRDAAKTPKAIAILPLVGIMEPRASDYTYYFGGTSTERFGQMFDMAIADPQIKAVLIDGYTPGGMVYGTPELAKKIYSARGSKPIVALANHMLASAGLWVGTAADRVYVTPSGDIGSHGVYSMHVDYSKMLEGDGVKVTFISAGAHKTEGNPYEPASQEFLDNEQAGVNDIMGEFTAALAKHRGVTTAHVTEKFGQGRLLSAKAAVEAGMADGIATFDQIVARLLSGHIRTDSAAANDDWESPVQEEEPESPVKRFGNSQDLRRQLAVARR